MASSNLATLRNNKWSQLYVHAFSDDICMLYKWLGNVESESGHTYLKTLRITTLCDGKILPNAEF